MEGRMGEAEQEERQQPHTMMEAHAMHNEDHSWLHETTKSDITYTQEHARLYDGCAKIALPALKNNE